MSRVGAAVHAAVSEYSCPLFACDSVGQPDLHATGVLLEVAGTRFLVTAAHAIRRIRDLGSVVHIGRRHIRPISDEPIMSSTDANDLLDVAVLPLSQEIFNLEPMNVLSMAQTTIGRSFSPPHFRCIHGFPCTKNQQAARANSTERIFTIYSVTYAAARAPTIDLKKHKKIAAIHIGFKYDKKAVAQSGDIQTLPSPIGMSGGGVWVVADLAEPKTVYLDAIGIEFHSNERLIFATRIDKVVDFIRHRALRCA